MNMPASIPLLLQLSQLPRFSVPPVLRRALLCGLAALVSALSLRVLSTAWHTEAEAQRNDARASMQKTASLLTHTREAETARTARAKRFALIKTALENSPPTPSEQEPPSEPLPAPPPIAEPATPPPPAPPPVATPPKRRFDGILWRGERIVALWFDGTPVDPTTEPTIRIGDGIPGTVVSGRQRTLSPGQNWPLQDRKTEP